MSRQLEEKIAADINRVLKEDPNVIIQNVHHNTDMTFIQTRVVPFEEEYYDIMYNPNKIWIKYQEKMNRVVNKLSYWKSFDRDDLFQQAYIYFVDFCKIYDPYYGGGFIPFDKYLFKNMIIKLRAFIQRYYVRSKREQVTEFSEYQNLGEENLNNDQVSNDIEETDERLYNEYVYSLVTPRQKQILSLSFDGYKQQEIGNILGISQSRVSVIRKKTLSKLNEMLQNGGVVKKKKLEF